MNKIINLANKTLSLSVINKIKAKDYVPFDLKITNSHIVSLNEKIGFVVFRKDSLYINSHSLWELMQPTGGKGRHNYHELTAEDVFMALISIKDPYAILESEDNKYRIISIEESHFNELLLTIVQVEANLIQDSSARINKIVTIYPKDKVENYLKNNEKDLLYKKP